MAPATGLKGPLRNEPPWPGVAGRRTLLLADASSPLERRILRAWIDRNRPEGDRDGGLVEIPPTRRPRRRVSLEALEAELDASDDPLLAPLRVAWLPRKRDGVRQVQLSDIPRFGDPRDPGRMRQRWVLFREPDRCRVVAGAPAPVSQLRARWRNAGYQDTEDTTGLSEFVARQAFLALERAERQLRGDRYKVPRLVREDILNRPGFRSGLARLARELGRSDEDLRRTTARSLKEIAATHSPFVIDIAAHLIRLIYRRGYGDTLHYDPEDLRQVKALGQRNPVVFLPSHKSNLDHLVLQYALHENGHVPNHTAGGMNMNFLPVGPIVRRSGVFFIRRSFKDDPVYKFTLSHYIDYLIEKRFSLEWYIEGGRSRSGKLLPPRFGLLASVVDAYRRGKADDVNLIPVSIAYDQIQDVPEYAAEQRGDPKKRESFSWLLAALRRMSQHYGGIHIRFGEPLSLAAALGWREPGHETAPDEESLAVQKLAFEVCLRINHVTPITENSLLTFAMLGSGFRALSIGEVVEALRNVLAFVRRRGLPTCGDLHLDDPDGVSQALEDLIANGVVTKFTEGLEPLYVIGPEQQLAAAYYRNTVIHFFLNACVAELALLRAAEDGVGDRLGAFWSEAMALRDLLKFEFFFPEKDAFREDLDAELRRSAPDWETRVCEGPDAIRHLVRSFRPFVSHRTLRPFIEAYQIVGDLLEREPDREFDESDFVKRCLRLGRQYHLQRRVHSAQSISQVLFRTALRLARNRGVLENGPDLGKRRTAFAEEIRSVAHRVEAIDALAASRRAGLIN